MMSGATSSVPLIQDQEATTSEQVELQPRRKPAVVRPSQLVGPKVVTPSGSKKRYAMEEEARGDDEQPSCSRANLASCPSPVVKSHSGKSPKHRHSFQSTRRSSKRCKSYSYRDFLPEWTAEPANSAGELFRIYGFRDTESVRILALCVFGYFPLLSDLVKRANDWLRENPTMTISNCETLCRMHTDRESAYDPELITMATSMSDCSQTYFVRGLRLWLSCHPKDIGHRGEALVVHDFTPNLGETTQDLVLRANFRFTDTAHVGRPITIESVSMPLFDGVVSSQCTEWSDASNLDLPHAFLVRVFTGSMSEAAGVPHQEGEKKKRQQQQRGVQIGFNELVDRANTWLREQPASVVVTNMQSIMQQRKKEKRITDIEVAMDTSCFFVLPGMLSEHGVEFLRVLRIAFSTDYQEEAIPSGKYNKAYPISYETFTPVLVKGGRHHTGAERLEKTKELFARVGEFTKQAMADIICIETVMNPLQTNGDSYTDTPDVEMRWILTTRIYISGPTYGYDEDFSRKLAEHSLRFEQRQRKAERSRHRPIFLGNVVGGRFKYRMFVAAGTLIFCMVVITVISVLYGNT